MSDEQTCNFISLCFSGWLGQPTYNHECCFPKFNSFLFVLTQFRLVIKTALKLLLVFVEYTESNTKILLKAVHVVDQKEGKYIFVLCNYKSANKPRQ